MGVTWFGLICLIYAHSFKSVVQMGVCGCKQADGKDDKERKIRCRNIFLLYS